MRVLILKKFYFTSVVFFSDLMKKTYKTCSILAPPGQTCSGYDCADFATQFIIMCVNKKNRLDIEFGSCILVPKPAAHAIS